MPPPRHCFGREDAVSQAVAGVLAKPAAPLAILGPAGVGKTTVAVTAPHDPRVRPELEGARGRSVTVSGP